MKFRSFLRNLAVGSDTSPRLRRPAWLTGEQSNRHSLEVEALSNRAILSRDACSEGGEEDERSRP